MPPAQWPGAQLAAPQSEDEQHGVVVPRHRPVSLVHVPPPGQAGKAGPSDQFGPGTRIPALVIAPNLTRPFSVDHAQHDTTSILATIEHRWGVAALSTRDAAVKDLSTAFAASAPSTK